MNDLAVATRSRQDRLDGQRVDPFQYSSSRPQTESPYSSEHVLGLSPAFGVHDHMTFPLEQIVEAHRYLESNQQIGKIVVTV